MRLADTVFRPFETLIRPLDLPIKPIPDDGPLGLVWHFARMFRHILLVVGLLSVLTACINLSVVWAVAFVVDGVVAKGAAAFLKDHVVMLALFAMLIALINPTISFISRTFLSQSVQTLLPAAMRWQAHKTVESQDVAFFEDMFSGQVASRISQVTNAVQRQMMLAIEAIPRFSIQLIGSFALLAVLAWPLAIPVFCWILANALLAWKVVPAYIQRSSKVAQANSFATGAMTDIYSNINMVKLYAAEDSEAGSIRSAIRRTVTTQHRERRYQIVSSLVVELINATLIISVFALSLWGMLAGFVTVGEFVAAATITRSLSTSAFAFISLGQSISGAIGTISDAMPVMTSTPKVTDKPDAPELVVTDGRIDFTRVNFSYHDPRNRDKTLGGPVIKGLSLSLAAGEKVGVVGLSGAGKSTLISLLLRLRDVDAGAITIDGQDVRDVAQASLRRQIGVVTQDVSLFHRSVRDNIRYGAPEASDSEIEQAVELAEAGIFIDQLRDKDGRAGLDAFVGDKGVKLSGGQRQRITIARVILKNAPILVLDEATSALDSEAEAEIQQNLVELMKGKTTIAIAHRLSTIAAMDRLVVMDRGRIVEQGTHEALIAADGIYAGLWNRQSGGFIAGALDDEADAS